jgi:hypothetical protein
MRVILWMVVLTGFIWAFLELKNSSEQEILNKELKKQIYIDSLQHRIDSLQCTIDSLQNEIWDNSILDALIYVESSYNDSAYRASEDAVGCLQIRKTMVNDVNRILNRQKSPVRFTYNDRWSRNKSIQMFNIYCKHYNLITPEEIARCWNGGPRGINNPATVGYWEKVKNKINS